MFTAYIYLIQKQTKTQQLFNEIYVALLDSTQ